MFINSIYDENSPWDKNKRENVTIKNIEQNSRIIF